MMWSFITCTHHQIVLGRSNRGWYVRGMGQKCTEGYDKKNLKEEDHLQNLGVDGILKWVLKMQGSRFEYLEWQQQIKVTLIQE